MSYKNLLLEAEEGVALLTVNRPQVLNALNSELFQELEEVLKRLEEDEEIKVVVLTGAGDRAFVAGADIEEMSKMDPLKARKFSDCGHRIFFSLENLSKPVIACVNGFALGGGMEIALACDFIYASEEAKFGQPEINLGIVPGFGGSQRLPRRIGITRAKELIFSGKIISAEEAYQMGLVNKIFPLQQLLEEAKKIAKEIANKGKVSLKLAKSAIREGADLDLASGCALEREAFALCFAHPDQKEGMEAFLQKRKPQFK